MRRAVLCLAVLAAGLGGAAGKAAGPHADATACRAPAEHAIIDGKHRCLRAGDRCTTRHDREYHRYGFHCHAGYLARDVWLLLRRPLRIPAITPGEACPTSAPDPNGDLSRFRGLVGDAWGDGPAYPVLNFSPGRPVLYFAYPPPPESLAYGSEWSGQKVMWVIDPAYGGGPVLVRGRQLDGPNELRFGLYGQPPPKELRLRGAGDHPAMTRLRAPGCYAYQADGTNFSDVIVFEARLWPR